MTDRRPITPTRIIPAGETLPAPAAPPSPPPPPRPPAPPAVPDEDPDWWRQGSGPSGPPPVVVHHHHVHVELPPVYLPIPEDPEPGPRRWQRIRIGYNAACAAAGFAICGPWAWVLASVRDEKSIAGAWVIALIPLAVLGLVDNARRVEAAGAHPDLIMPKIKAAVARVLLWAAALATVLTLPVTTIVFFITGVHA